MKLQFGEYVSLGKVESELKTNPLVENICIYAESSKNNVVAIVSPDQKNLKGFASGLGMDDKPIENLCNDKDVKDAFLKQLVQTAKKG